MRYVHTASEDMKNAMEKLWKQKKRYVRE
jgi:hypothetical protein